MRNKKKSDDTWIDNELDSQSDKQIDNQIDSELHGKYDKACEESTVLDNEYLNDEKKLLARISDSQPYSSTNDQAVNYIHSYDANLNQV